MYINILNFPFDGHEFVIYLGTSCVGSHDRARTGLKAVCLYDRYADELGLRPPRESINWNTFLQTNAFGRVEILRLLAMIGLLSRDREGHWLILSGNECRNPSIIEDDMGGQAFPRTYYFKRRVDAVGYIDSVLISEKGKARLVMTQR